MGQQERAQVFKEPSRQPNSSRFTTGGETSTYRSSSEPTKLKNFGEAPLKVQPHIENPEDKVLLWANTPKLESKWIEQFASQLNLDGSSLAIGHILSKMQKDDMNSFIWLNLPTEPEAFAKQGNLAKIGFEARTSWELNSNLLPADIQKKLRETREFALKKDWTTQLGASVARAKMENFRQYVTDQINDNPALKGNLEYYHTNKQILDTCYSQLQQRPRQ
jgi:hypothetical protein